MGNVHSAIAQRLMADSKQIVHNSFVETAGITLPEVHVPGALEGWKYNLFPAKNLNRPVNLFMQFSIGDFLDAWPCSSYFQPASPWYNVFYGSYAIQSFKPDGTAWGFDKAGMPDYDEFFEIPSIDYNYFTAGMFGAPPSSMCFQVTNYTPTATESGWEGVAVKATIPSGLHVAPKQIDYPWAYLMYGVPNPVFVSAAHPEYEPVAMTGLLHIKQIKQKPPDPPITLAWGALCPEANGGPTLLGQIVSAMSCPFLEL
jgi:hypothetical protein